MTVQDIQSLIGDAKLYPRSIQHLSGETYCFVKDGMQQYMIILFDAGSLALTRGSFSGEEQPLDDGITIKWCFPDHSNARKLRRLFPWTVPQPIGLERCFAVGDRLGLAAPAHIQAARDCDVALILARHSMHEMARTGRTPDAVLDAATWGAFQEGYQQPWGAAADHLKTEADVRRMADAGFTFFSIDPSEYVDDNVLSYDDAELERRFASLDDHQALADHYIGVNWADFHDLKAEVFFDRRTLLRAAIKYSRAVAHGERLVKVLDEIKGRDNYDLEMSVAETATPTSVEEHFFIASELVKRGIHVESLAIRFVGEFQKGIDYIGNLEEFKVRLRDHMAISEALNRYKISIHSGSDKFSIFPIIAEICDGFGHVKTAGTWYLEALRVAARCAPELFREICDFAAARFATERTTYRVVEDLQGLPDYKNLGDSELETVLDNDTGRQMLHVTFGAVLTDKNERGAWRFRDRIYRLLSEHEDLHYEFVARHSRRHLEALGMCAS